MPIYTQLPPILPSNPPTWRRTDPLLFFLVDQIKFKVCKYKLSRRSIGVKGPFDQVRLCAWDKEHNSPVFRSFKNKFTNKLPYSANFNTWYLILHFRSMQIIIWLILIFVFLWINLVYSGQNLDSYSILIEQRAFPDKISRIKKV